MPRSTYPLVDVPQGPNPMQSLSSMMTMATQWGQMEQQQHERDRATRTEKAINEAKGDPFGAASVLEKQGDFATARTLREKATEIRQGAVDTILGHLNDHKTLLGQGEQMLTELQAQPDLYPQLRPKLVDLATQVDPALAAHIPEAYDPKAIESMVTWTRSVTEATNQRVEAARLAKEKLDTKQDAVASDAADRKIVSNWFSVSPNQEDWDQSLASAKALGISDAVISKVGPTWSNEAMARAREIGLDAKDRGVDAPSSFNAAILAARQRGNTAEVDALIALQDKARDHSNDRIPVTPGMLDAVVQTPALWGDLSAEMRNQLLGPLQERGFDFRAAASGLTDAQRAQTERWMQEQLQQLEGDISKHTATVEDGVEVPPLEGAWTPAQIAARKLTIYNSYRTQMGLRPVGALPPEWQGKTTSTPNPAPKPPTAPAAPVAKAGNLPAGVKTASDLVGKRVKLKDGRSVTVTAVKPDGSIEWSDGTK